MIYYTPPAVCGTDLSTSWFVFFDITNELTGETARKQFRGGINYSRTVEGRKRAANTLCKVWANELRKGWNPWGLTIEKAGPDFSKMTLIQALDFALEKSRVSTATARAYKSTVGFVKRAAFSLQIADMLVVTLKRQNVRMLLESCQKANSWSSVGYNKHLCYLHALLGRLLEWDVLEYNPADKIATQAVAETQKFVPLTTKEKEKLQEHLFTQHYPFFVFLMVIYHTGMRPKEILALKISDIDLARQRILITPDLAAENSKTKKIRDIPINNHLLPFLREMRLDQHDPSWYIFGSPAAPGSGNRGRRGALDTQYFTPSPVKIKRDTVSRLWKKIVWDGLKIKKYCYALKHTGGDDKILAGLELDALRELYGHSSKFMTEKYAGKVKEVYRERIMQHSPGFVTKK